MLRILANGPFVPKEIQKSKNYYDYIKKKKNLNNNVSLHSNLSNKNTDFISTNNINNNISNYTNINNDKKNYKKEIKNDYLNEFIENITKKQGNDNKNYLQYTFQDKLVNNKVTKSFNDNNNIAKNNKSENNNVNDKELYNKSNSLEFKIEDNQNFPNNINNDNNIINNENQIDINYQNNNDNYINDLPNNNHVIQSYKDSINNNNSYLYDDKNKEKNKIKSINTSLDNLFSKDQYIIIENIRNRLNSSTSNYRKITLNKDKRRVKSLSNKLKNIKNFEKYDTLINNRKIKKAGLQKSISNLENSIKIFKKNNKLKEKECLKLSYDNKKLMTNNEINKEKIKDYDLIQNLIREKNNDFIELKKENNKINEEIMIYKNETFAQVEERLYKEYPEYRETNNYFLAKGNQILRFKTIKENKIGDGLEVILVVPSNN